MLRKKNIFGLNLIDEKFVIWQEFLQQNLSNKTKSDLKIVMTPNPEQIMLSKRDKAFKEFLNQADLLLPDGWGLVWAGKLSNRITGVDSVQEILKIASKQELKILLIGGKYTDKVQSIENGLEVISIAETKKIFYTIGYRNVKKPTKNEEAVLQQMIKNSKPDVVLVAFGAPAQEKWLIEHKLLLQKNGVRLAIAVGGTFDFLLEIIKRAPNNWQKNHFEWLWRLIQEPKRIKRQLVLPLFGLLALKERLKS